MITKNIEAKEAVGRQLTTRVLEDNNFIYTCLTNNRYENKMDITATSLTSNERWVIEVKKRYNQYTLKYMLTSPYTRQGQILEKIKYDEFKKYSDLGYECYLWVWYADNRYLKFNIFDIEEEYGPFYFCENSNARANNYSDEKKTVSMTYLDYEWAENYSEMTQGLLN